MIINYQGKGQIEYLLLTWPGFSAGLTGTNKNGITIAFNRLEEKGDLTHLSEPTFFTIKRALRSCASLDEVVKILKKTKPMDSGSVMITDAKLKKAVVIEIIRGKVAIHQSNSHSIGNQNAQITNISSVPICRVAQKMAVKFDVKETQKLMTSPLVLQNINLLSVVFSPQKNKFWLSCGKYNAAKGPFTEYVTFPKPSLKLHKEPNTP